MKNAEVKVQSKTGLPNEAVPAKVTRAGVYNRCASLQTNNPSTTLCVRWRERQAVRACGNASLCVSLYAAGAVSAGIADGIA